MARALTSARLVLFATLAGCFALFLQFRGQVSAFTYLHHRFSLAPGSLGLIAAAAFILLLGLWAAYSALLARVCGFPGKEALRADVGTYAPLLFFGLAPLSLGHYLTHDDLALRLGLLALAVLSAVVYLKVARAALVLRDKPAPWLARLRGFFALSERRQSFILFIAALVVYNGGSLLLSRGVSFSGDEPHYLLITHSLLHDGDFDLADNYARQDYGRYLPAGTTIRAHTLGGRKPGGQYSFHSPGVSILLLPFYALGELLGKSGLILLIRFAMSLAGALFGVQLFLFARREWPKPGVAFGLWLLVGFSAPVFFYAIHVYPELIVALFALAAFRMIRHPAPLSNAKLFVLGFLLTSFVWFHALKYFFLMGPLCLYAFWVLVVKRRERARLIYALIWPVLGTALYLYFQYTLYGSLNPTAVSWQGAMDGQQTMSFVKTLLAGIPFRFRLETLLGYFLDQRDGLLLYAPVYVFAFAGVVEMVRRRKRDLWLVLAITAPYILVSAFLTQRTGYAPQARPLVAAIWGLAVPLGYFLTHNSSRVFGRMLKVAAGLGGIFVLLLCLNPSALYQETTVGAVERGGELFYRLSHLHFYLPTVLPSFIKVEEWRWWPNFVWPVLLGLFVAAYALLRPCARIWTFGHHRAFVFAGLAFFFIWYVIFPRTILNPPRNAALLSGDRLTFYGLSRVALMNEPARFSLLEDNRDYYFYFTSRRPLARLRLDFGSTAGDYALGFGFLDLPVFTETTSREVRSRVVEMPPAYRWKKANLYRLTIHLERKSDVRTGLNPYLFAIQPAR